MGRWIIFLKSVLNKKKGTLSCPHESKLFLIIVKQCIVLLRMKGLTKFDPLWVLIDAINCAVYCITGITFQATDKL